MSGIPDVVEAGGAEFVLVNSPTGLTCWTANVGVFDAEHVVSIVVEPPSAPSVEVVEVAAAVVADFDRFVHVAADFLCERLRSPEYGLLESEMALLTDEEPPFDDPEAVVWADGTWMLRFSQSGLQMAAEYGIGVNFVGTVPHSVEDLSAAELVEEE